MNNLSVAFGKRKFRLMTFVVGFSAFLAPFSPLVKTSAAQSRDVFPNVESVESNDAVLNFEKDYLQFSNDAVNVKDSETPDQFPTGNAKGGGTVTPTQPAASPQWTIAAKSGVKIFVNHEGWYRVSANELMAAGFDTNPNRANWQLFSDAQEQPIKVNADGSVEFYGKGLDTLQTDERAYFLINGQTAGKRIPVSSARPAGTSNAVSYDSTAETKQRVYYVPSVLNGDANNWFGEFVDNSAARIENLSVTNPDISGTARLTVKLQGLSTTAHTVNVKFNNLNLGNASYTGYQNMSFSYSVPMSAVVGGTNQVILQVVGSSSDYSLVDSVSLSYKRLYQAENNSLRSNLAARKGLRAGGFTENSISVYELVNGQVSNEVAVRAEQSGGTYGFSLSSTSNNRELLAITESRKESPLRVEPNNSSTWNSTANNADFVIIAPPVFLDSAQTLANMRISQGLNTKVVLTDDIYDEFSNGARSAQGIKDFLARAATSWTVKPRYVLLFGDSSYDSRGYLAVSNRNFVPTKMVDTYQYETASDSWYADFNNDMIEDLGIGRLPAGNPAEAALMVDKLARYDAQPARQTKKGVFVADTYFTGYNQQLASIVPATAQATMINRSEMSNAQMQQAIFTQGSDNPLLVVYTGHGTPSGWTNASLLHVNNAANLTNNQLGFYMVVGCLNGYSQDPYNDSLAEGLLKAPNGAMGVFASSTTITVTGPTAMSQALTNKVFNSAPNSLRTGDMLIQTKQNTSDADAKRTYQLFGDPTVFVK